MRREAEDEVSKQFSYVLDSVNEILEELEKDDPDIDEATRLLYLLIKEL